MAKEITIHDIETARTMARNLGAAPEEIDEILSDVLYALAITNSKQIEIENLQGWLYVVTKNAVNRFRKEKKKREGRFCDFEDCMTKRQTKEAFFMCKNDIIEGQIRLYEVINAIKMLDKEDQKIVVMYYLYEYGLKDIAAALDFNINTVKTRKRRAIAEMRKILIEGGIL